MLDQPDRMPVLPRLLGFWIEPDRVRVGLHEALHPHRARLFVVVLDAAARLGDFVWPHRRVADKDHLVVVRIGAKNFPRRGALVLASRIVSPHAFVYAIMKVENLEMLELGPRRGEQFLAHADMAVHRTAGIEKQQHLHRVVPLGAHLQI